MDVLVEVELKDALALPGCALCRIGEDAARRYLRFLLHESVNDVAVRARLIAAWGFCRRHACSPAPAVPAPWRGPETGRNCPAARRPFFFKALEFRFSPSGAAR